MLYEDKIMEKLMEKSWKSLLIIWQKPCTAIVFDTAQYRLFRPVHSDLLSTDAKTHFIRLDFINKSTDAVNLPSMQVGH